MKILKEISKKELKQFLYEIDRKDSQIYDEMNTNNGFGIFQFSGPTALGLVKDIKPQNFDEMAAINALARPGTIAFAPEYKESKFNGSKKYPDAVSRFLSETKGHCLFQEQIMEIVKNFSNGYLNGTNRFISDNGEEKIEEEIIILETENGNVELLPYERVLTSNGIKQAFELTSNDILI